MSKAKLYIYIALLLFVIKGPSSAAAARLIQYLPANGLPSYTVYQCVQDKDGFLWFATDAGLSRFDGRNFTNFTVRDGLPDNEVLGFYIDTSQKLRIFTFNKKVSFYDPRRHKIINESIDPTLKKDSLVIRYNIPPKVKKQFPFETYRIRRIDEQLYFATDRGVYIFTKDTVLKDSMLEGSCVYDILQDRERNLWFTTATDGVFCRLQSNVLVLDRSTGLSSSNIQSVYFEAPGTLYAGGEQGIIDILEQNKKVRSIQLNRRGNKYSRVRSMLTTGDNMFVAVTDWGTATSKNRDRGDLVIPDSLYSYNKTFAETKDGNFFLLGGSSFLDVLEKRRGELVCHIQKRITSVYADKQGRNWFGSIDGLYTVDISGNTIVSYASKDTALGNTISFISGSSDGIVWVATHSYGVVAILPSGQMKHFTEQDGLISDIVRKLYVDTLKGDIWVATYQGLGKLHYDYSAKDVLTGTIHNYTLNTGLADNQVNDVTVHGDTVYAATAEGLCIFRDEYTAQNIPVFFTKVKVGSAELPFDTNYTLDYLQNDISVSYAGICYNCGGKLKFAYRLLSDKADMTWKTTSENSIEFAGLSPGKYLFQVKAEGGAVQAMTFTILPPFWQRLWFYFAVLILTATLLGLLYNYRIRIIKKREAERSAAFKQIAELELKLLQAQLNPHFIFNALNSIQMYINVMDKKRANEYLVKLSRLMRLFLEASKEPFSTLQNEITILSLYCDLEKLRFEDKFEYKIECGPGINKEHTQFPSMLLQPFVENAINHGLMLKEHNAFLLINFTKEDDKLRCVIEDNGIGRKMAQELQERSGRTSKSWGVNLSEERMMVLNKMNGSDTSIEITDKTDNAGNATGTKVTILVHIHLNKASHDI